MNSHFKVESNNALNSINKYCRLNDLRLSADRIYIHHPHIKIDYFKLINTKEKAYWFGFLYAKTVLKEYGIIELIGEDYKGDMSNTEWKIIDKLRLKEYINWSSINFLLRQIIEGIY